MKSIWIIAKRELNSFFDSLIAYILLILFLLASGFFTWLYGNQDIFMIGQASLNTFFKFSYLILFLFIPALTMRLIAEEKRSGTIELLLTKAVTDRQVIIGKFLSTVILVFISFLFTLPYVITLSKLGNLDNGGVICGYIALLLMSSAYISVGLFMSSITNNQIIAFLLTLLFGIIFHLIFLILGGTFNGWLGTLFQNLSISTHFESMSRGVIDTKDIIYFASIIFMGLFLSELSLSKRNLSN